VLGISDRVIVMREGQICGELARSDASETAVLALALPDTIQAGVSAAAGTAPTASSHPAVSVHTETSETSALPIRSIA